MAFTDHLVEKVSYAPRGVVSLASGLGSPNAFFLLHDYRRFGRPGGHKPG